MSGQSYEVIFVWIPSNCGIEGNERADELAMTAGTVFVGPCQFPIELYDFFSVVRTRLRCNYDNVPEITARSEYFVILLFPVQHFHLN